MNTLKSAIKNITGRECFDTYRRCLDIDRSSLLEYDDAPMEYMAKQGETIKYGEEQDASLIAREWKSHDPALKLFLDGSRRTYKLLDLPIGTQVFPVIAGQVGVGVCKREDRQMRPCELSVHIVLAFPDKMNPEGNGKYDRAFCGDLRDKLNAVPLRVQIDAVLLYSTQVKNRENFEDKGVARIQEYMIEREKEMVDILVHKKILDDRTWLVKDGSLEYTKVSENDDRFSFSRIRNNYKRVIGVSKSFNPELARLKNNRSAAGMIAKLKPEHRTPVSRYAAERFGFDVAFAVWYVRLRNPRNGMGPFDGIVKVEKLLLSEKEFEFGLESSEVDNISGWLLNERNPVCYGKDVRWANHLYPVYLTESYIKSKYRGWEHFVNLF